MHDTALGFGYPSDSSREEQQRARDPACGTSPIFVWPPGRACAARWPWNLRPDNVGRWTTRKPIDAAPRARFKSARILPQRVTPTAFGTTGRLGLPSTPAAPPGDPRRAPLNHQSDGEAVPGPQQRRRTGAKLPAT